MAKKLTSEQKVKRALAAFDSAVQEWYKEHSPNNKECYAFVHIRNIDNYHVSNVTLKPCTAVDNYTSISSSRGH